MAIHSIARALTCAAALLVLVAAATSSASVTVTDGALTPRVVVIPAGGSVLWTNRGSRQHQIQIVAQRSALPRLQLGAGRRAAGSPEGSPRAGHPERTLRMPSDRRGFILRFISSRPGGRMFNPKRTALRSVRLGTLVIASAAVLMAQLPVAAQQSASVIVTEAALTPKTVTIGVGGSILWVNHGVRMHRIASDHGVSPGFAFSLAAGGSKRVPFARARRYPYTMDGSVKGTIIVVAAAPTPGGSAPATEEPSTSQDLCRHGKIYYYDIEAAVHHDVTNGQIQKYTGSYSDHVHYKATWNHVPVKLTDCGGDFLITAPEEPGGYSRSFETSDDTLADNNRDERPPCTTSGTANGSARLVLHAGWGRQWMPSFGFNFVVTGHEPSESSAALAQCAPGRSVVTGTAEEFGVATRGGVTHPSSPRVLGLDYSIADETAMVETPQNLPARPLPFPLPALAAGRAFAFDTGVQHARCDNNCAGWNTYNVADQLLLTFTPSRH